MPDIHQHPEIHQPDVSGDEYVPYTQGQSLPEFTLKAVLAGIALGMVFGGANTYLGLKAGLTISTSIPVAVLTVILFRTFSLFGSSHSILELNMSQTVGSASSSVASGVLFTIPALFIWGMPPTWRQMTLLAMSGGLLGVLAMIPLRRYLIQREHQNLPYPEGTACAEVLVAAQRGGKRAWGIFYGFALGIGVKLLTGLKVVTDEVLYVLPYKGYLAASVSPALVGVGYILGIRIASVMAAGGTLAALVLIPCLAMFGDDLTQPLYPETEKLISQMSIDELWSRYIRYIGAGAVATGGLLTLIRSVPTMAESFQLGLRQIRNKSQQGRDTQATATDGSDEGSSGREESERQRRDEDLPLKFVLMGAAAILLILTFTPGVLGAIDTVPVRALASLLVGIFAFFFVTVSARIVGLVGVTSNPTSGMTIATLLGTSLIFYLLGWTDLQGKATALMVGTAVCIAASIAGDTSQDLKTGFLLGATPRRQQIGELIGVLTSAGVVCLVLQLLHQSVADSGGLGGAELPAPQAMLMKVVIDGVLQGNLPWELIYIGVGLALVAAMLRLPVLAFAVGVYLPLATMATVFLGGVLRWLTTRGVTPQEEYRRQEQGVLIGSGLVGGEGLTGVILAIYVVVTGGQKISGFPLPLSATGVELVGCTALAGLLLTVAWLVMKRGK